MGRMGLRISPSAPQEVWARNLSGGAVAVGLYNKLGSTSPAPPSCPSWNHTTKGYVRSICCLFSVWMQHPSCSTFSLLPLLLDCSCNAMECIASTIDMPRLFAQLFNHGRVASRRYLESCSGNSACFSGVAVATALDTCCKDPTCAGFSFDASDNSGCYKLDTACGSVNNNAYEGYYKPSFKPAACGPTDISVDLTTLGFAATDKVTVRDIWAQANVGVVSGSYTAKAVPCHGTAFLKLTKQ